MEINSDNENICIHLFDDVKECLMGFGICNGRKSGKSPCCMICYVSRKQAKELLINVY